MGARMVDFGGWEMPVQYTGLVDEHHTVRKAVGLFDVSHMGEIEVRGPEAVRLVDYVTTNAASRLHIGQAQYSGLLYEHGGFVDDILVHKVTAQHYFLCVNAANQEKDFEHIRAANHFGAELDFASDRYAQIAVRALSPGARCEHRPICLHRLLLFRAAGFGVPIARTGYTGEDGSKSTSRRTNRRASGASFSKPAASSASPCGLGALTPLRLEAKANPAMGSMLPSRRLKPVGLDGENGQRQFIGQLRWRNRKSRALRKLVDSKCADAASAAMARSALQAAAGRSPAVRPHPAW
jgi:aminomethyltransferase